MAASRVPRILIVDDDQAVLERAQRTLKRAGFSVAKAASASRAFNLQNNADLLVLSLKLLDGKPAQQDFVRLSRLMPFIVIARSADEKKAARMLKRGALEYVIKDAHLGESLPMAVRRSLERGKAEKRLAQAQAALAKSRAQMLTVSEREQRRFGAELHDSLGQQLTTIELRCQSLKQDLPKNKTDLHSQIAQICQFLRDAITQTRSMAHALAPLDLRLRSLVGALQELAVRMSKTGKFRCNFHVNSPGLPVDTTVAGHLFRIAQEAVNNAVKHSRARTVNIDLARDNDNLVLTVSDNGVGFSPIRLKNRGIGLQLMQHRASAVGGKLEIQSKPGRGVNVSCVVPIQSE